MLRIVIVFLFIFQILGASIILGSAIRNARQYRVPFGRNFISEKQQLAVLLWLLASLIGNVFLVAALLN